MMLTSEQVMTALTAGPQTVSQLREQLGANAQDVSNRLQALKNAGSVHQPDGTRTPWSLVAKPKAKSARAPAMNGTNGHASTNGTNGHAKVDDELGHPPAIGSTKDPIVDGLLERRAGLVAKIKAIDEAIRALVE